MPKIQMLIQMIDGQKNIQDILQAMPYVSGNFFRVIMEAYRLQINLTKD